VSVLLGLLIYNFGGHFYSNVMSPCVHTIN